MTPNLTRNLKGQDHEPGNFQYGVEAALWVVRFVVVEYSHVDV